jgi:hypothetical protein
VMTNDAAAVKRRRARRPTEAAARLERLRKRNTEQLEAQREAERRIESALQAYVDADVSISAVERACEEKVNGLERQIEQARTAAQQEVEQIRAQQAVAVWKINDSGRTAEQIAELLEIPHKDVRRLLSAGRTAAAHQPTPEPAEDRSCDGTKPPDQAQPQPPAHDSQAAPLEMPSEQRILSGVDAQQHGPDQVLVPSITHCGGQGT